MLGNLILFSFEFFFQSRFQIEQIRMLYLIDIELFNGRECFEV